MTENSAIFDTRHGVGSFHPHRQPAPTAQACLKRGNGTNWRTTRQLSGECRVMTSAEAWFQRPGPIADRFNAMQDPEHCRKAGQGNPVVSWGFDSETTFQRGSDEMSMPNSNPSNDASILVYEKDFQLKVQGRKGIFHPSEDLIRLIARGQIAAKEVGEQALDFGVGDGRHVNYLMSLGYRVTGTDVAPSSLEVTQEIFGDNINFRGILLQNSPQLPFADRKFSLILAWEVLHWLGSPDVYMKGMKELLRVMRPDGVLLLTMPTERHYLKRYSLEVERSTYCCKTQSRMDCVFYSPNLFTLRHIFEAELGLSILQTLRYEYGSTSTEPTLDDRMSFYGFCLQPTR
jgi:SAM-dependent methyltransferase